CTTTVTPPFAVGGPPPTIKTRNVEPRNTPTMINAVYFFDLFWDGRAKNTFNGVDPFGNHNPFARIFQANAAGTSDTPVKLELENAALASQSVGPPLSTNEMACADKPFAFIGQTLRGKPPLQFQFVATQNDSLLGLGGADSVLGPYTIGG